MVAELPAVVPGPVPPDDRDAWYAPDIRAQYPVGQGVVATVSERADGFHYEAREPFLGMGERRAGRQVERDIDSSTIAGPRTRADAIERMAAGIPDRWIAHFDDIRELSPSGRRRLGYHLGADLRGLGELTPLALDERIRIGDASDETLTVHTRDFAPVRTDISAETEHLDRFLSERVDTASITFEAFEVPVTIVRRHLLGEDAFATRYAVHEPDLLPGDRTLIETVKDRLVDSPSAAILEDASGYVIETAKRYLARRLRYRESATIGTLLAPFRAVGRRTGLLSRPLEPASREDRIDDLAYYVARDLAGEGALSIPIRDPRIRSVEANRVGERVKVVPHPDTQIGAERMPTTLSIDDRDTFLGLARSIAAAGGVELSGHRPAATVDIEWGSEGDCQVGHASVSLPVDGDGSAHISIRKRRAGRRSPTELVELGVLDPALVAGIWTVAANGGNLLFVGPADAEPASVLEAHAPFIPSGTRPVVVEGAGSPIDLPHETAVTVPSASAHSGGGAGTHAAGGEDAATVGSGREQMRTRTREALHPDVMVVTGAEDPQAQERVDRAIGTGRSVVASARAESRDGFVRTATGAGFGMHRLAAIDLVVEIPSALGDASATGWVPRTGTGAAEPVTDVGGGKPGHASNPGISWEPLLRQDHGDTDPAGISERFISRLAGGGEEQAEDRTALSGAFDRRVRYVEYLVRESMTDVDEVTEFLAALRTDEAATIERIQRSQDR